MTSSSRLAGAAAILVVTLQAAYAQQAGQAAALPRATVSGDPGAAEQVPDTRQSVPDSTVFPYNSLGLILIYGLGLGSDSSFNATSSSPGMNMTGDPGSRDATNGNRNATAGGNSTSAFYNSSMSTADSVDSNLTAACTGALISPIHVLTAAHCIYDLDMGDYLGTEMVFLPGYNTLPNGTDVVPYGAVGVAKVRVSHAYKACIFPIITLYDRYTYCGRFHDFGLLTLDRPVVRPNTNRFDYFTMAPQVVDLPASTLYTAGYPSDFNITLVKETCAREAIQMNSPMITLPCKTWSGQSGSPLWTVKPSTGERLVVGVLSGTSDGAIATDDSKSWHGSSAALMLNGFVTDQIEEWGARDGYDIQLNSPVSFRR